MRRPPQKMNIMPSILGDLFWIQRGFYGLVEILCLCGFCCVPRSVAFAQTGITEPAPLVLQEGVSDCNGFCITVDVAVDVTGLVGSGGDAGLNAFVLAFDLDRPDVYASARPGTSPSLDWAFFATERGLVGMTSRLFLVGAVGDNTAPNQVYHVATLVLCGTIGDVCLSFVPVESSLGSRVVAGDGPGDIPINPPSPFTVTIPVDFPLDWGTAIASWIQDVPAYDLAPPMGTVDVLDLTKLVDCGQP